MLLNAPHSVFTTMKPPFFRAGESPSLVIFSTFSTYAPLVPVPKMAPVGWMSEDHTYIKEQTHRACSHPQCMHAIAAHQQSEYRL